MRPKFLKIQMLMLAPLLAVALSACEESSLPADIREKLTRDEMVAPGSADPGPILNKFFLPSKGATDARHEFAGQLRLRSSVMRTEPAVIEPAIIAGKRTQLFPALSVLFLSHDGYLIPVERDILFSPDDESFWQIQVSPGRVWSEAGDGDMSRASFPFILTSNIENETYNGVATFLYDGTQVSHLRYQVTQQLSPYFVQTWFVASGHVAATFTAMDIVGSDAIIEDFRQELAARIPWDPWENLEVKVGRDALSEFDSSIEPDKFIVSGLITPDEVFVRFSPTPYGPYPYPQEMRHGIWSITKSAAGLIATLRLAQKYGDEILDYRIRDLLEFTAEHDGWDKVTIGHLVSMATGIGAGSENIDPNHISDGYIVADQDAYDAWYLAPGLEEKLQYVFRQSNHPWGPGEHVRYRDRDIFLLAVALSSLLKQKEGDAANLWTMLVDEVYTPIGIRHMPANFTKETSGEAGMPLLAWGLYMTIDDIVKLSRLIQNGGQHNGEQILSPTKLAEARYLTDVRGLPTGASNQFGDKSYHMTFWHEPYTTPAGSQHWVSEMHGWGGNVIAIMPNGTTGFRIGNGGYAEFEQMISVSDKLKPFDRERVE
ncbi:MAG: serine hydrolase [Proteobacteria bacterium]|nr:serine hydrolase [Pseudomonadota bacterium]